MTKILKAACSKKKIHCFVLLFVSLAWAACHPTKKLLPNEYLVDKVEVLHAKKTDIQKENLEAFFRQKPNRKLLRKIHFFVWWYNLFDTEKINKRKIKRNLRFDKINTERIKKNEEKNARRLKKAKRAKAPKLKNKESTTFFESVRDIGEPPVVLDSALTEQTRLQLARYLFSKGYFNATVSDSIFVSKNSKRATIKYILYPKDPYTVNEINYNLDDKNLGSLMLADTVNTLLKKDMRYDEDVFRKEAQRMTNFALNSGYYFFENAFINFTADSALSNHSVILYVKNIFN